MPIKITDLVIPVIELTRERLELIDLVYKKPTVGDVLYKDIVFNGLVLNIAGSVGLIQHDINALRDIIDFVINKIIADGVTSTDKAVFTYILNSKDVLAVSDDNAAQLVRPVFDNLSIAEQVSLRALRPVIENAHAVDTISLRALRPVFDTARALDLIHITAQVNRAISDVYLSTDSVSIMAGSFLEVIEEVIVRDQSVIRSNRPNIDVSVLADSMSITAVRSMYDALSTSDALSITAKAIRDVSDSYNSREYIASEAKKVIIDHYSASDALSITANSINSVADALYYSDSLANTISKIAPDRLIADDYAIMAAIKSLNETASTRDSLTTRATKQVSDSLFNGDSLANTLVRPMSEQSTPSDALKAATIKILSDTVIADDIAYASGQGIASTHEYLGSRDTIMPILTKAVLDNVIWLGAIVNVQLVKALTDQADIADSMLFSVLSGLSSTYGPSDSYSSNLTLRKSDSYVSSDRISVFLVKVSDSKFNNTMFNQNTFG